MNFSLESIAYHRGEFLPLKECDVNIATHAFQYGTMIIGGVRAYFNTKTKTLYFFRLADHIQRLFRNAHILQMNLALSKEKITEIFLELAQRNKIQNNAYFRPFIYKSALQISPRLHDVLDDFSIYTIALDSYLDMNKGLRLSVSSWRRVDENMIPVRVKSSGAYINSALAKSEVVQNGFDEAIFLDSRGFVSEGSAENIFIVRDNVLITPPAYANILEGITRGSIIDFAKDLGISVLERDIARGELYIADEVFLCGTGAQVAWVQEIDYRKIGEGKLGPCTKRIREHFLKIVYGEEQSYSKWLTQVKK